MCRAGSAVTAPSPPPRRDRGNSVLRPKSGIGVQRHDGRDLHHAGLDQRQGGEVAAHFGVVGRLEHHAAAGDVATVPDLAHRTFGVERAALFGLAWQKRCKVGVGELCGVAGEKGKELHVGLLWLG
ncbi:mlr7808 [Mesorhizobium japonicum MAFF 303099]|uniref:Mlr7808 protein n=1 Tax=Mesorhizobium japonicum (strain LMG 29417 / CECT 9101 / MAFF 303099) TaxID=266835 RepID=Q984X0_RHILO|nr:mlr7808 [Mesorhizobium japonicum MAFF 303099]